MEPCPTCGKLPALCYTCGYSICPLQPFGFGVLDINSLDFLDPHTRHPDREIAKDREEDEDGRFR